jgi:putative transposase
METKRRQFSAEFKTQVVLAAIREEGTLSELAGKYGVHPMQICKWRKEFLKEAPHIFSKRKNKHLEDKDELIEALYRKVGKAEMEAEWLKKKIGYSP